MKNEKTAVPAQVALLPTDRLTPHPGQDLFPALTDEEYAGLRDSIAAQGVQVPLCVTAGGEILCGVHRHKAARELGLQQVPAIVLALPSADAELSHMAADNFHRRHLTPKQRAAIWFSPEMAPARAALDAQARARKVEGGKMGRRRGGDRQAGERVEANPPQPAGDRKPQTRDLAAEITGVSPRTADAIKKAWEHSPDRMRAVAAGTSKEAVWAKTPEAPLKQGNLPGVESPGHGSHDGPGSTLVLPMEFLEGGQMSAELMGIVPIGTPRRPELGVVWRITASAPVQPILVQRIPDDQDEEGWAADHTPIGRFAAIVGRRLTPEITNLSEAVGQTFLLDVALDHEGPKVMGVSRVAGAPQTETRTAALPESAPEPGPAQTHTPPPPIDRTPAHTPAPPAVETKFDACSEDVVPVSVGEPSHPGRSPRVGEPLRPAPITCQRPGCTRPAAGDNDSLIRCERHRNIWGDDVDEDQGSDAGDGDS